MPRLISLRTVLGEQPISAAILLGGQVILEPCLNNYAFLKRKVFTPLMMCVRIKLIHSDSPFRLMCGNLMLTQENELWIFYFLRCATSLYNLPHAALFAFAGER